MTVRRPASKVAPGLASGSVSASSGGLRPDPAHWFGVTCAACGSGRITRISMTLTDGTPVDFTSCHDCEHKTWSNANGHLALTGVLAHARRR